MKPELSGKNTIPSLLKCQNPNIVPVVWMSHPNLVKACVIVYESNKDERFGGEEARGTHRGAWVILNSFTEDYERITSS